MSVAASRKNKAPEQNPVFTNAGFYGGSFLVVGLGVLGGIHYTMKKEKESLFKNKTAAIYASKALALGTLLCFGTFGLAVGAFVTATGISSFKEFGEECRKAFSFADVSLSGKDYNSPEMIKEEEELNKHIDEFMATVLKPKTEGEPDSGKSLTLSELYQAAKEHDARMAATQQVQRKSPLMKIFSYEDGEKPTGEVKVFDWVKNIGDFLQGKTSPEDPNAPVVKRRESPILQLFKKKEPAADTIAQETKSVEISSPTSDSAKQKESPIMQLFKKKEPATEPVAVSPPTPESADPLELAAEVFAGVLITELDKEIEIANSTAPASTPPATYYSYFATALFGAPTAAAAKTTETVVAADKTAK